MATAILSPALIFQGVGQGGLPLPFGKLFSYVAGTNTPSPTYTDSTQTTQNTNPVILNANGQAPVFLNASLTYKFVLQDVLTNQIYVTDQVQGSITAAALTTLLTQALIGGILYPITPAEGPLGANLTIVQAWYPPGYIDRYGINTTPGITSMRAAWQAAINQCRKGGAPIRWGATQQYLIDGELDCTFTGAGGQFGLFFIGDTPVSFDNVAGSTPAIIAKFSAGSGGATTGHLFDFTGCTYYTIQNLSIATDPVTFPKTCFFKARNNSYPGGGSNSQFARITNTKVQGSFSVAIQYNFASEDGTYVGNTWENQCILDNASVIVITGNNINGLTSSFTTITASTAISCTDHEYFGGQYVLLSGQAHSDVVRLEFAQYVRFFAPWMHNASASAGGRSFFFCDTTNNWSSFIGLYSIFTENTAHPPANGVLFGTNVPASNPTCWHLEHCAWFLSSFMLSLPSAGVIDRFQIRNNQETNAGHGISCTGGAQSCTFDNAGVPIILGISTNNALIGQSESWTITTRSNDSWMDTGTTNKSFSPGIANGVNGWTTVGAITQSAKANLNGSTATVTVTLSAATSVACTAGATIAMPAVFHPSVTSVGIVTDDNTGAVLGACLFTGGAIQIGVAIGATAHTISVNGTFFVA